MASYTGKALAPMLIGKYPSETLRDGGHFNKYVAGNTFLAERLRRAGSLHDGRGVALVFPRAVGARAGVRSVRPDGDARLRADGHRYELDEPSAHERGDQDAGRHTRRSRGSFSGLHYFDPHEQYVPHEGAPDFSDPSKPTGWKMRAAYDGEVWFTDQAIGRLLDYIAAQPWGKDTVVVVTSDHGEAMNEHGIAFQHGFEIWEPLMRVPLILAIPGEPPAVPVKRSVIDLVPTLLDLMRIPQPGAGRALGAVDDGRRHRRAAGPYEERDVYMDMPDGPYTHLRRGAPARHDAGDEADSLRRPAVSALRSDERPRRDRGPRRRPGSGSAPMVELLQAKRATLKEIFVKPDAPMLP